MHVALYARVSNELTILKSLLPVPPLMLGLCRWHPWAAAVTRGDLGAPRGVIHPNARSPAGERAGSAQGHVRRVRYPSQCPHHSTAQGSPCMRPSLFTSLSIPRIGAAVVRQAPAGLRQRCTGSVPGRTLQGMARSTSS